MIHVYLMIYSLALVLGIWVMSHVYQIYKRSGEPFFHHLAGFLLFFNLSLIVYQLFEYIIVNCFGYDFTQLPDWYRIVLYPLAFTAELGMARAVLDMVLGLTATRRRRLFLLVWLFFGVVAFLGYAIGWIVYLQSGAVIFMRTVYGYLYVAIQGGIIVFLAGLLVQIGEPKVSFPASAIRTFAIMFLVRYGLWCIMLALPWPVKGMIHAVLLFLTILVPFYWIRRSDVAACIGTNIARNGEMMSCFSKQYALSNRELEIAALILEGKSNQEIEDALFISFNTVKNHIYRIYQKLGVNSRGQLVKLVLDARQSSIARDDE